jgi:hypothetical protein
MKVKRQKKHRTLTRAGRVLAAVTVLLSLLSIQQVWAEEFCACDHSAPSSSASGHCSQHAAQHQHCEEADGVTTHQHAARHEHAEETHSAAIQEHAEPSSGCHAAHDAEPSGPSATTRFEASTNNAGGDGSGTPAKLICCHILPTANLPASSAAVYSADFATDSTPVVFEIGAARTVVASTVLHPPRARPIYLAVSSLLI